VTVQSLLKLMLEQSAEQSDMVVAFVVMFVLGKGTEEAEGVTSEVSITVVVEAAEDVSDE